MTVSFPGYPSSYTIYTSASCVTRAFSVHQYRLQYSLFSKRAIKGPYNTGRMFGPSMFACTCDKESFTTTHLIGIKLMYIVFAVFTKAG